MSFEDQTFYWLVGKADKPAGLQVPGPKNFRVVEQTQDKVLGEYYDASPEELAEARQERADAIRDGLREDGVVTDEEDEREETDID